MTQPPVPGPGSTEPDEPTTEEPDTTPETEDDDAPSQPDEPAPAAHLQAQLRDLQGRLDSARRLTAKQDKELTQLKRGQMNEAEKAAEVAREEGRREGALAGGAKHASAEFRARAAGKLPDPSALVETIEWTKFVTDEGEPDTAAIDAVVEKLAASLSNGKRTPPAPSVPAGPRPDVADDDWLRQAITKR